MKTFMPFILFFLAITLSIHLAYAEEQEYYLINLDGINTYYSFKWDAEQQKPVVKFADWNMYGRDIDRDYQALNRNGELPEWGDLTGHERAIIKNIGSAHSEQEMINQIREEVTRDTDTRVMEQWVFDNSGSFSESDYYPVGYTPPTWAASSGQPAVAVGQSGATGTPPVAGSGGTAPYAPGSTLIFPTSPTINWVVQSSTASGEYRVLVLKNPATGYTTTVYEKDGAFYSPDSRDETKPAATPFYQVGSSAPSGPQTAQPAFGGGSAQVSGPAFAPGDVLFSFGPASAIGPAAQIQVPSTEYYVYPSKDGLAVSNRPTLRDSSGATLSGIRITEEQFNLINTLKSQGVNQVRLDGLNVVIIQEKKTGVVTETTTYTIGSFVSLFGNGVVPLTTKTVSKNDGKNTLIRSYLIDEEGKETLTTVKTGTGQTAPFASEQFTLNDKGNWLYDGREGKLVQDAANGDRFEFADGSYVQKIGDTLVEKRVEGNKVSFVLTKDGKSFTVPENLLSATFKDLKSKEAYVAHLPEYQDILKNNRLRQEDFSPSPDGRMVSRDRSMSISFDGTNYLIQRGTFNPTTGNLEASSDFTEITLRRNQDGSLSVAEMRSKKGAAGIEIVEFPEAGGVVLNTGGTTRAFTREVKETGGSGRAFCDTNNVCIHPETGQMFTFKDGKFEDCDTDDCKKLAASLKEKLDEKRFTEGGPTSAERNALQWLGAFESARSGFGSFASLLIGEENLASWRRQVDDFFCSTILLGGKECWVSEICSVYIPRSQKSTLIIQTPTGEYAPVAHVEGERQSLTFKDSDNTETQTEFLYKISLGVRNPEDSGQDVTFNVLLKGPVSDWLWEKDEKVEEGAEFRKAGKDMALLYRNETFTQACLVFKDGIVDAEGKETSQLCNAIVPAIR